MVLVLLLVLLILALAGPRVSPVVSSDAVSLIVLIGVILLVFELLAGPHATGWPWRGCP